MSTESRQAIEVWVNGQTRRLDGPVNVAGLLAALQLTAARVAVEVNEQLVPRRDYQATAIRDADRVEIVTFVGGG